jgi:hypothetical protein
MTGLERAALRRLALNVLAQHVGPAASAEEVAVAARRAHDALVRVSIPLIGQIGVDALIGRALHLAQREYPWLGGTPESRGSNDGPFTEVIARLAHQEPVVATEGAAAVFATYAELLVTFIGESVTTRLLRQAWPEAFSDTSAEET